jgi:hypothetical protein
MTRYCTFFTLFTFFNITYHEQIFYALKITKYSTVIVRVVENNILCYEEQK